VVGEDEERDLAGLQGALTAIFPLPDHVTVESWQPMTTDQIQDQLEDHAEVYYDMRAQANGVTLLRQFGDEGLTLANLSERGDPFNAVVYSRVLSHLGGAIDEAVARLPLRQLPEDIQQVVADGVTEGAALYRDRLVMVRAVDERWVRHLTDLDSLREGIGLRAFAQIQPLVAYKKEAYEMFQELMGSIESDIVHAIFRVDVVRQQQPVRRVMQTNRGDNGAGQQTERRTGTDIGRNDPCWCGSGKKYKHCHMRSDQTGTTSAKQPAPASRPAQPAASKRRRSKR
jgi:preprotein translocase subunit SecA